MPTAEPALTPRLMLGQMLRAVFKLAKDAVSVRFASREAVNFTVAGQTFGGYFYYPNRENNTPGILLLATAAGLTPHEHAYAARLARAGYTTLVVRYTKRTMGRTVMNNEAHRKRLEQVVAAAWRLLLAMTMWTVGAPRLSAFHWEGTSLSTRLPPLKSSIQRLW